MSSITIEHNVTPAKLDVLFVDDWPTWSKEVSEFDWTYDRKETCYIIEGKAIITPEGEEPVTIQEGDMVFFPRGMKCVWKVIEPIEKPRDTGVKCPKCHKGTLMQRKSRRGKIFYSCSTYPKCDYAVWNEPLAEDRKSVV